jgi:hypothetical protein
MTNYKGTGGPPPSPSGGSRFKKTEYSLYESLASGEKKKVSPFMLKAGQKDVPVVVLDDGLEFTHSVRLHTRFKAGPGFNNHVVCLSGVDPRGCPLCEVKDNLGKWFVCGTVLDGSEWAIPKGPRAGEIITHQRRLLLVNARQLEEFKDMAKDVEGWRGQQFKVSRNTDEKSSRIGTRWTSKGRLTQEQLIEKFKDVAAKYGMPVEQYVAPINYDKMLEPMSREQLQQIANVLTANAVIQSVPDMPGDDEVPF